MSFRSFITLTLLLLAAQALPQPVVQEVGGEEASMPFLPDELRYSAAYLDSMAIDLDPGSDRPYLFSGIGTSFFYGTTATAASEGWMGLHVGPYKLLDDWVFVKGGIPFDRAEARVTVKPFETVFDWGQGVTLTVAPVGLLRDDLRFTATGAEEGEGIGLFFVFPAHVQVEKAYPKKGKGIQYFRQVIGEDTLFTAIGSERWFEAHEMRPKPGATAGGRMAAHIGKSIHGAMFNESGFDLVFTWGQTAEAAGDNWVAIRDSHYEPQLRRKLWLLEEINRSAFRSSNERVNKAVNWAKVSLASLFAENETVLWAGLPWFNEGWARDTFISLPGAALVTGKFDAAAKLLRTYARWQVTDPDDPVWGKVPNRARFDDLIYNTADGTPWYIRELYEYGLYSGDRQVWRELAAPGGTVEQSVEGALKHRVDDNGFLTHDQADTWMDAKGPEGAWSPRGDRAVEIQALWLAQLDAALAMMREVDPSGEVAGDMGARWMPVRDKLVRNFPKHFVREDGFGLVDHLDPDGSRDLKIRPNQLWAVTVPLQRENPLLSPKQEAAVVQTVRDSLVYEWGVASLAQTDDDFHPFHQSEHYPKDAAYHNGTVWTWLSGPYKSASRAGYGVTANEIHQILDRGAPGTLSENLDALPRSKSEEPNLSGTVSQAWSLAEFLRTVYQDDLGLRPVYDQPGAWSFDPRLPEEWGDISTVVWMNGAPVRFETRLFGDEAGFTFTLLDPERLSQPIELRAFTRTLDAPALSLFPGGVISADRPRLELSFLREGESVKVNVKAGELLPAFRTETVPFRVSVDAGRPLLQPRELAGIASIQPPAWPMLPGALVKAQAPKADVVIEATDPAGDDTGLVDGKTYQYPTDAFFQPGILDVTGLTVRSDGVFAYIALQFANLVDPGWHEAYGYQLTFTALAIDTGEPDRTRRRELGRNSRYMLPEEYAADRFVFVGGGFEVEDANGEILAAHRPTDPRYKLGNTGNRSVSFAVPLETIGGDPANWRIAVLVGGQDDHGGGGIGEFRAVNEQASRWQGGGAEAEDPNLYDSLFIPRQSGR